MHSQHLEPAFSNLVIGLRLTSSSSLSTILTDSSLVASYQQEDSQAHGCYRVYQNLDWVFPHKCLCRLHKTLLELPRNLSHCTQAFLHDCIRIVFHLDFFICSIDICIETFSKLLGHLEVIFNRVLDTLNLVLLCQVLINLVLVIFDKGVSVGGRGGL